MKGGLLDEMEGNMFETAVSPYEELGAYEHLWSEGKSSFKNISERLSKLGEARPSELVGKSQSLATANKVHSRFKELGLSDYGIMLRGTADYPAGLLDARYPLELLYYRGDWNLTFAPSVAIVGTRKPSKEGRLRAQRLASELGKASYTIISGLADGIDTEVHQTCLREGIPTVAVIGTPLAHYYPKKNRDLQDEIASKHLLISQVPLQKYEASPITYNRFFFPERNVTMSALSRATVIVEAGETSGTLVQARAAFAQGRKLFILNNCFENSSITWPKRFEDRGAIRVRESSDILKVIGHANPSEAH